MDLDQETRKFKIILFVAVVFVASSIYSCNELKYARNAKTTEATIDGIDEPTPTPRRDNGLRRLRYHYHNDQGELRNASDTIDDEFVRPPSGKVMIEYLADSSRLAGHRNTGALIIFFVSLAAMLVGGVMFWQYVRKETRALAESRRASGRTGARRY